jgi:cytochrome c oxidase subunit 4
MADMHDSGAHHGPDFRLYMVIAAVLGVFTLVSFVVNWFVRHEHIGAATGFVIILGVAVAKATLVGMYFMHLKYDWGRLYFLIIPAFILGTMMMMVLLPDTVIAWHHDAQEVPPPVSQSH